MRKVLPFFLLVSTVAIIALTFTRQQPRTIKNRASESQIAQLTNQLIEINNTRSLLDDQKLQQLTAVAAQRKELMLESAKKNPEEFLQNVLSSQESAALPSALREQNLIEEETDLVGTYFLQHKDDFKNKKAYYFGSLQVINSEGKKELYILNFAGEKPVVDSNTQVAVEGFALAHEVVVETKNIKPRVPGGGLSPFPTPTSFPIPRSTGNQKIAVIMFNFNNDLSQPYTTEEVRSYLTGTQRKSVARYFQEASYSQLNFTADIFGWLTLPVNKPQYMYSETSDLARQKAAENGVILSNYDIFIYLFPRIASEYNSGWTYLAENEVWINGYFYYGLMEHEIGHTLGLQHASSYSCRGLQIDRYVNCERVEYGDSYDVMGGAYYQHHMSGANKLFLRWLQSQQVQEVSQSGTHTLSALELPSNGLKVLRLRKPDTNDYYFITYQRPTTNPYSDDTYTATFTDGTMIRIRNGDFDSFEYTYILDTAPFTNWNIFDAPLTDNNTFYDFRNNISIKQISHTDQSAVVQISFDPITVTPQPTFTLYPTFNPSPSIVTCPKQSMGDIDCDGRVTLTDFEIWRFGYFEEDNR